MIRRLSLAVLLILSVACTVKDEAPAGVIPAPADVAKPPENALKTPSGIASRVLSVGLGSLHPTPTSTVTVTYTGWTTGGQMFDSSAAQGGLVSFKLTEVIPGWTEALQLMVKGEKRRFWIPGNLAYDSSPDSRNPKGTVVFDIELLDVR